MKLSLPFPRRAVFGKTLRPMLERLAFACHLALFVGACGLTGLGLIFALFMDEVRPLCVGLAGGALSRILHQHGYRVWNFRRWEESLEPSDGRQSLALDPERTARANELSRLLGELSELKESVGGRDVWAVQDLRRRAAALLRDDAALREDFAGELAKHPEIG
jgi:hypothetical protein